MAACELTASLKHQKTLCLLTPLNHLFTYRDRTQAGGQGPKGINRPGWPWPPRRASPHHPRPGPHVGPVPMWARSPRQSSPHVGPARGCRSLPPRRPGRCSPAPHRLALPRPHWPGPTAWPGVAQPHGAGCRRGLPPGPPACPAPWVGWWDGTGPARSCPAAPASPTAHGVSAPGSRQPLCPAHAALTKDKVSQSGHSA